MHLTALKACPGVTGSVVSCGCSRSLCKIFYAVEEAGNRTDN